jgi:hypothetical protein
MASPPWRRIEPFWRDIRVLRVLGQFLFLLGLLAVAVWCL